MRIGIWGRAALPQACEKGYGFRVREAVPPLPFRVKEAVPPLSFRVRDGCSPLTRGEGVQCWHWVAQLCRGPGIGCMIKSFGVQGWPSKVQGSGFRVQGSGFRVQGLGCRIQGEG